MVLLGKCLVKKGKLNSGESVITLTGVFRPSDFSINDIDDKDEMWVTNLIVSGGLRFKESLRETSPEDFLTGVGQKPSDYKVKENL